MENERLKQELKSCRGSEGQKLDTAADSCSRCPHAQVSFQVGVVLMDSASPSAFHI